MKNKTPQQIWSEYQKCVLYNSNIGLYDTVKENENCFIGKQWEGVNAPDLDKPVFNFLKRVVVYFISMIVSDDISANIEMFREDDETKYISDIISSEIERLIENTGFKDLSRDMLRNTAVDGDGAFYIYFNPDINTGQAAEGDIDIDIVRNTCVYFGNPQSYDKERQPAIYISIRKTLERIRDEAKKNDIPDDVVESIRPDTDSNQYNSEYDPSDCVTEIVKLWKKDGTVWCSKSTETVYTKEPYDTRYTYYPLPYMSWDKIENSYHGQACITGLLPNQRFVNKLFAMMMESVKKTAFPKVLYDKVKLKKFTNKVGEAIGVDGDPNNTVYTIGRGAEFSNQVMDLIDKTITYTKDFMGANDSSLGNIKPENTSAIIAAQQGSAIPLSLQKKSYYKFVEDSIRIMIDIMATDYGVREVKIIDDEGNPQIVQFDFSQLKNINYKLNVDIGSASYFSEVTQIQTIDNLFSKGIIDDAILYLESIPKGLIRNQAKIIAELKKRKEIKEQLNANSQAIGSKNEEYEQMAQFIESLPEDMQIKIKSLPADQMEQVVREMMKGENGGNG